MCIRDRVERYMDVYSDSALLLLEQIPHPEKLRGKQRADYVLLLTQARDKNLSLIHISSVNWCAFFAGAIHLPGS